MRDEGGDSQSVQRPRRLGGGGPRTLRSRRRGLLLHRAAALHGRLPSPRARQATGSDALRVARLGFRMAVSPDRRACSLQAVRPLYAQVRGPKNAARDPLVRALIDTEQTSDKFPFVGCAAIAALAPWLFWLVRLSTRTAYMHGYGLFVAAGLILSYVCFGWPGALSWAIGRKIGRASCRERV